MTDTCRYITVFLLQSSYHCKLRFKLLHHITRPWFYSNQGCLEDSVVTFYRTEHLITVSLCPANHKAPIYTFAPSVEFQISKVYDLHLTTVSLPGADRTPRSARSCDGVLWRSQPNVSSLQQLERSHVLIPDTRSFPSCLHRPWNRLFGHGSGCAALCSEDPTSGMHLGQSTDFRRVVTLKHPR